MAGDSTAGPGAAPGLPCPPVGVVHTPIETTEDAPRQGQGAGIEGRIELEEAFSAGLAGVEAGDSLDVVWYADRADRGLLVLDDGRGVFSTRSPARPVPVCVTRCRVLGVDGVTVRLRGVDMLDGTPVLDLKRAMRRS